jgi:hypothetical protein
MGISPIGEGEAGGKKAVQRVHHHATTRVEHILNKINPGWG